MDGDELGARPRAGEEVAMPVALNWMESERSLLAATLNTQKHASAGPSDRIAAGDVSS